MPEDGSGTTRGGTDCFPAGAESLHPGRDRAEHILSGLPGELAEPPYQQERDALVGDVTRFRTVDKFLAYTGIAPVTLWSDRHESRLKSQFGRRALSALSHRIASTQLVVHKKTGVPRNLAAKAYYEKHLGDQAGLPREKQDRKRLLAISDRITDAFND